MAGTANATRYKRRRHDRRLLPFLSPTAWRNNLRRTRVPPDQCISFTVTAGIEVLATRRRIDIESAMAGDVSCDLCDVKVLVASPRALPNRALGAMCATSRACIAAEPSPKKPARGGHSPLPTSWRLFFLYGVEVGFDRGDFFVADHANPFRHAFTEPTVCQRCRKYFVHALAVFFR